jgi:hypothetical protein
MNELTSFGGVDVLVMDTWSPYSGHPTEGHSKMQENRRGLSLRSHFIIAAALFGLEIILGIGLTIGVAFTVAVVVLAIPTKPFQKRFQVAAIYTCVCFATLNLLRFNWRLSQNHAAPVIAACKDFRQAHGRYPDQLTELVPEFLSSVPRPSYTLVGRRFAYVATPPNLCFAAMFHGIVCYDFPTDKWKTND